KERLGRKHHMTVLIVLFGALLRRPQKKWERETVFLQEDKNGGPGLAGTAVGFWRPRARSRSAPPTGWGAGRAGPGCWSGPGCSNRYSPQSRTADLSATGIRSWLTAPRRSRS